MNFVFQPRRASPSSLRNRRLPRHGRGIGVHPELLGALSLTSFPAVGCELSTINSPFNFKLSTLNRLLATPFPATHTGLSQIAENAATLSPAFATLTSPVKHNSFVCHSYRKHPGWGMPHSHKVQSLHPSKASAFLIDTHQRSHLKASLNPLESTPAHYPTSIDSKRLTLILSHLYATLTKNQGVGWHRLQSVQTSTSPQLQPGSTPRFRQRRQLKMIGCCRTP